MATYSGKFITFEGPDGSGKTTQITMLANLLQERGYSVFLTREPGGTSIGEKIRQILHDPDNTEMIPRAEILLYSASRAQLVDEVIRPRLESGEVVLCDRFYDSTFAYQGHGRGLSLEQLRQITEFAVGGLCPDLTIYIDINPAEGQHFGFAYSISDNDNRNKNLQQSMVSHVPFRTLSDPRTWGDLTLVKP